MGGGIPHLTSQPPQTTEGHTMRKPTPYQQGYKDGYLAGPDREAADFDDWAAQQYRDGYDDGKQGRTFDMEDGHYDERNAEPSPMGLGYDR